MNTESTSIRLGINLENADHIILHVNVIPTSSTQNSVLDGTGKVAHALLCFLDVKEVYKHNIAWHFGQGLI